MGKLYEQLAAELRKGMEIPEPMKRLYDWIEEEGMYYDNDEGRRIGTLFPEKEYKKGWRKTTRDGGTDILFSAQKNDSLGYWFGFTDKRTGRDVSDGKGQEVLNRLCIFARTGGDGSMGALWLGEDGKQRIVHLGSGSGSTLVCVLAEDAVDFLRLLAIGYDEICWNDQFAKPPNAGLRKGGQIVKPNKRFQKWVEKTFGVTIPETAAEIVKHAAEMGDTDSEDLFFRWTEKHVM
jgi:hypothetical protein